MARAKPTSSSTVSPFILQGDQEGGDLRMAGLAAQNNLHGGFRIGGRQVLFGDQANQVGQKRHDILGFL